MATVRDLRYHFSEIEARLARGEELEIRKRVIARLVPVQIEDLRFGFPRERHMPQNRIATLCASLPCIQLGCGRGKGVEAAAIFTNEPVILLKIKGLTFFSTGEPVK